MNSLTTAVAFAGDCCGSATTPFAGAVIPGHRAESKVLTIAYNVALPSWDPTTGPSAVNPTIQSIYKAVFDSYIDQIPNLSFKPGLLTKWGWNKDKTKIAMTVRKGAFWHDGTPVTPEDVVWSLERAGDPKSGNPIQFVWGKIGNFKVERRQTSPATSRSSSHAVQVDGVSHRLCVAQEGLHRGRGRRLRSQTDRLGPYMVEKFERNAYIRLKAFPKYWGPKPAFETVVFKLVPDATSRSPRSRAVLRT